MDSVESSEGTRPHYLIRDMRGSEGDAFLEHVVTHAGHMDRELGMIETAKQELSFTFGPGPWFVLRLLGLVGKAPARFLMADVEGHLIGTTITVLVGPWGYVAAVGVSPAVRRQGVARALMVRAEELGRRARKHWLVLDVDADNLPARTLYSGLGFTCGLPVEWWRMPPEVPVSPDGPDAKGPVRRATPGDQEFVRSRVQASMPLPLLPRMLHPVEFSCQSRGVAREDLASGPEGSPTYLVRTYAASSRATAFMICLPSENATPEDSRKAISTALANLRRFGAKEVFASIQATDVRTRPLLESLGASHLVSSETWWKPLR